ncbi:MAG: hypothetical protein HC857_10625 [Synechococcales cyanobacterium RU_4_20]|nr:hypothetical protein [Synechococcales cyanobacterium RU_4_20]
MFYRAHYLSGNTAPVDALCEALRDRSSTRCRSTFLLCAIGRFSGRWCKPLRGRRFRL